MKRKKYFLGVLLLVLSLCLFAACSAKDKDKDKNPDTPVVYEYVVSFDTLGGNTIASKSVKEGNKVEKPTDPVRSGYTFTGWYKNKSCTEEFDFETEIRSNTILYAGWIAASHTVSFESNGGSSVAPVTVEHGKHCPRPENPTRSGYNFVGWFKDSECTIPCDFINGIIISDLTCYAKWTAKSVDPNHLTVEFNSKGGSIVADITDIVSGSKIQKPADPVRKGYTFVGWFKNEDGTLDDPFDFENEPIVESMTLLAVWSPNSVTITLKDSLSKATIGTISTKYEQLLERPEDPKKSGYKFVGWSTKEDEYDPFDFDSSVVTDLTILYAFFTVDSSAPIVNCTVQFKNGEEVYDTKTVQQGFRVEQPTTPTNGDLKFTGWYTDPDCKLSSKFDFNRVISDDLILYAGWVNESVGPVNEYIVKFDTDGGTTIVAQKITVGGKVTKPENPIKYGYDFVGWFEHESSIEYDFNLVVNHSFTLYAKWEKNNQQDDVITTFNFAGFNTLASSNLDSSTGKTNKDLTIDQFKVLMGVKATATTLNTQGKNIEFTLTGKITNSIKVVGSGGSTNNTTTVTLMKWNGTEYVHYADLGSTGNKVSKIFEAVDLEAGNYRLDTDKSLVITVFTLTEINKEAAINTYTITFNSLKGSDIDSQIIAEGKFVQKPIDPVREGYDFKGWYTDPGCNTKFDFSTPVTKDLELYALWEEAAIPDDVTKYTVHFITGFETTLPDKVVAEGRGFIAPEITRFGYTLEGWYTDTNFNHVYNFSTPVYGDLTLYAHWAIAEYKVTLIGTSDSIMVTHGQKVPTLANPSKIGYTFGGWYTDNSYSELFDFNTIVTSPISIFAKWVKNDSNNDELDTGELEGGEGQIGQVGAVQIVDVVGQIEAAYITFKKVSSVLNISDYTVTIRNTDSATAQVLDEKNLYFREYNGLLRADIMGLPAGTYEAVLTPKDNTSAAPSSCVFKVGAYDRSGYAHFNYTDGVGAYHDDGSLKENAIVLYVTDENKNTVELSYKGTTVKGIGNILNSVGADVGTGLAANGGTANTNQGIIKKLAEDNIPLVVRFVGCVSDSGLKKKAPFSAASTPLIEGLTIYNSTGNGGTAGDNGHMARIKSGKDVTLEGLGEDAVIDGWGFHYMAESSSPTLGKSFEVRNLTFINTPEDAIGMEGVQASKNASSTLTASVERCWIHNNEFYGPNILNPAESDKGEGDGSCDFKRGQYFTCSYNYFEGCHKTNLVGSADYSLQFNLTYHHNYWKLCKARGPLTRRANVHMYNNVFEGQTDYAMNTRADAYIYSEYNLFYMCKSPHGVEGGAIKSYNDSISSALYNKGSAATAVTNKSQKVANNCQFSAENIDYSSFDTDSKLSYIPDNKYMLQTNVTDARKVIAAIGGVRKDSSLSAKDITMSQLSYKPSSVTPVKVTTYPTTLNPGKLSKTVYAFTLDKSATVTVSYPSDTFSTTGVLVNEAGECLLTASGSVVLKPGTYMIQPVNFQPGDSKNLTNGTFKDLNVNSIQIEEYKSDEFDQQLIDDYDAKAASIPSTITYSNECYKALLAARLAYELLSADLKERVTVPYETVVTARERYIALGKEHVEGLIDAIGTVNKDSGGNIAAARREYESLKAIVPAILISNYNVLTAAETAFKGFAVESCIEKINAIGIVTLASGPAIQAARNEFDSLNDEHIPLITNYQVLLDAEEKYESLLAVQNVIELLDDVDLTNLNSLKTTMNAYNALTTSEKAQVPNTSKLSDVKVAYASLLIDAIGTVSVTSGVAITEAEAAYNALDTAEKAKVTNYAKLVDAKEAYADLLNRQIECTFIGGSPSNSMISVSGGSAKNTSVTIAGKTYESGVKINSKVTISFTTEVARKLVLHIAAGGSLGLDGTQYTDSDNDGVIEIELSAGSHEIKKNGSETALYALILQ
ncbi:MAG: InlB B-repeat-containing protein [Anaeroplasmataceae bacterium]|nr:InlB B-repeat-containing protein [Anaeroplasmataceae bacterium]